MAARPLTARKGRKMTRKKILIADDEPYIVRSLAYVMKREGYEVATAANGEEAIMKYEEFAPDVLFLDLSMPKKNGYEVTHIIRNDPAYMNRDPYVIILTAKGEETDRYKGYLEGADDYITKPFSPLEIVSKLKEHFQDKPR